MWLTGLCYFWTQQCMTNFLLLVLYPILIKLTFLIELNDLQPKNLNFKKFVVEIVINTVRPIVFRIKINMITSLFHLID